MPPEDRLKWDRIHRERGFSPSAPSSLIVGCEAFLPRRGVALDVAAGSGRHALWLAERGLRVTLSDVSPVGLELAAAEANRRGLEIDTLEIDLEAEPLPAGPWDVILCFHFLHRPLFAEFARSLSGDGVVVVVHPTRSNLLRHARPGERHLLEDGEMEPLARKSSLEPLRHEEGWLEEGRHEALLVARRAGKSADGA